LAKVDISPELGHKLREFRLRSGIRAKELAQYIGKTPAYITKLEKGDFKTMDEDALQEIVKYITSDENGYERFIDDFLSSATEDEIKSQLDIMHFDMLERSIPVPKSLIVYINTQLQTMDVSIRELVNYINENDDYDDAFFTRHNLDRSELKTNTFYPIPGEGPRGGQLKTFILYKLFEPNVRAILSSRITVCPHVTLFAIVYNLLKLENGGKQPVEKQWQLKSETTRILTENKFYTILDRSRAFSKSSVPAEYTAFLSSYDKDNFTFINDIFEKLEYLSNYNVVYTNEKLEGIARNLNEDSSFTLSFMALPISRLAGLTVSQKKEFLELIRGQIDDYLSTVGSNNSVELY